MENSNLDETRPINLGDKTQPHRVNPDAAPHVAEGDTRATPVLDTSANEPPLIGQEGAIHQFASWRWLVFLSLLALLIIATASAFGGYRSGIGLRTSVEATHVAQTVREQFELGLRDMEAQRYEVARQRFEYVIQLDPNYPGVTDKLAEVLLHLNTTATPTPVPTPTLTPTVDLRSAEELFNQARMLLADRDWTGTIETLLRLRKNEPDYQAVKVDSMLYVALRNRGVDRILNQGDLEGGTYDLALAERFGLLDVEAKNYRTWADIYVTGASYWELDWPKAIEYFSQLLLPAPNLRDSSGMTAVERYRMANIRYGDFLAANGDWCAAREQYNIAFEYGSDPAVEPTASYVATKCEEGEKREETKPPVETPPPVVTPTPGGTEPTPATTPIPTEPYPAPTTPPQATQPPPYPTP